MLHPEWLHCQKGDQPLRQQVYSTCCTTLRASGSPKMKSCPHLIIPCVCMSLWGFACVRVCVCVCVCVYIHLTMAQPKISTTHRIKIWKDIKSDKVKMQFPCPPPQLPGSPPRVSKCSVSYRSFQRYSAWAPLPGFSFSFQNEALYFRQLYILKFPNGKSKWP